MNPDPNDAPVVLITGASKGIGRGLVHYLSARKFRVVGCSRSEMQGETPEGYAHHSVDVTNESEVRKMISSIRETHKRIDIVINSAGVGAASPAMLTPLSTAEQVFRTNYLGTFLVSREAAKSMLKSKWGRIINITSIASVIHMEGSAAYAASKSAVLEFSKVFAKELAPANITVNVIAPSLVETDMMASLGADALERYKQALTIKRLCTMDDIGATVEFFASKQACYITGQVLHLGFMS